MTARGLDASGRRVVFPNNDASEEVRLQVDGIDLGMGHWFLYLRAGSHADTIGIVEYHPTPDGEGRCAGTVRWSGELARHQLVALNPLTISPSLHCLTCGSHGWVRDGLWVNLPS